MILPIPASVAGSTPRKRGPRTPEGKARSRLNALKHGLRAREFALLPEESSAEWAEHVADLRRCYSPVDEAEEKLMAAIAVAMWKEIRADRMEAGVLMDMPFDGQGRGLAERRNALSLGTAIRYATAAGMATQRALRAFLVHRKAKQAGLILPAARNCTNELPATAGRQAAAPAQTLRTIELPRSQPPFAVVPGAAPCTNEMPQPGATRHRPEPPPAQPASAGAASAQVPPLNRHERRRREALARQARPRAA